MQASDTQMNFEATKPDILIVNQDTNIGITQNLTKYLEGNCEIIAVKDNEDAHKPVNCVQCGKCEAQCPQKIAIREDLKKVQADLDKKEMML